MDKQASDAGRLAFIPPMLPTMAAEPPLGDGWIHEVKLDGYRSQIVIDRGGARIYTRSGLDWSSKYVGLVEAAKALNVENAIIDGEAIVTNEAGLPDFTALQKAVHSRPRDLYLAAFDILHLNGRDLRDLGVEERRDILQGLVRPDSRIQFSEAMPSSDAKAIFYMVDKAGLEGIVSKRKGSKYRSGRTTAWLKTKSFVVSELELLGVVRDSGNAAMALLADPETHRYVGSAFIALPNDARKLLWQQVREHTAPPPKVANKKRATTQWVEPGRVMLRVKHLRGEHKLRAASVLGLSNEASRENEKE